jgi:acylphosphatase
MDEVIRHFLVIGKVQGVFFRQSARHEAERLGVQGSARNLADGSVEVWARGSSGAVDALHRWLNVGPARARVDTVRELPADAAAEPAILEGFAVF